MTIPSLLALRYAFFLSLLSLNRNLITKGIWSLWIEVLIAVHYCYEIFGIGEVDDIVGVTGEHDYTLNLLTRHFIFENLSIRVSFIAKLDESMTADYDKLLPFGVVPVLALSNSRFGDINTDLTTVEGVDEFGETTSIIDIHLEVEDGLVLREIAKVGAVETLCETIGRNLRNYECLRHIAELTEEVYNLSEFDMMGYWSCTIASLLTKNSFNAIELAMMLLNFECADHLIHEVVTVEELHIDGGIVDGDGEVIGDVVTKGSDS